MARIVGKGWRTPSRVLGLLALVLGGTVALGVVVNLLGGAEDGARVLPNFVERAEKLEREGDYRGAAIELKNAVQQDHSDPELRLALGRVYLAMNAGDVAAKELLRAIELGLDDRETRMLLARAWLQIGETDRVLEAMTVSATESRRVRAEVAVLRGEAFMTQRDFDAAAKAFQEAADYDPAYAPAFAGLARLAILRSDMDAVAPLIETAEAGDPVREADILTLKGDLAFAANDHAAAEALYRQAIDLEPYYPLPRRALARTLTALQKHEEADTAIEELIDVGGKREIVAVHYKSVNAYQAGRYEEAANLAVKIIESAPDFDSAYLTAGGAYYYLGSYEQARKFLQTYFSRNAEDPSGRRLLGETLLALGEPERGVRLLEPLGRADIDDPSLFATLSEASARVDAWEDAVRYLERAVELQPDSADLRTKLAASKLALGERDAGLQELKAVVDENPEQIDLQLALIREHLRMREFDEAIEAAEAFSDQNPDRSEGWALAGVAYLVGKKDTEQAEASFTNALSINPGDTDAATGMADIYSSRGDLDAARTALTALLTERPGHLRTLSNLANIERKAGDPDAELVWLQQGVDASPDSVEAHAALAEALLGRKAALETLDVLSRAPQRDEAYVLELKGKAQLLAARPGAAVDTFEQLADAYPDVAGSHVLLALAHEARGNIARALESAGRAFELAPDDLRVRTLRARLLLARGETDAFRAELQDLFETAENHFRVVELRGIAALRANEPEAAGTAFAAVLEGWQDSLLARRLALAQWRAGQLDAAIATLQDWVDRYPGDVSVHFAIAQLGMAAAKYDLAIAGYEELLAANGDSADIHDSLARAYFGLGRMEEAESHAQRAYALDSQNPLVAEMFGLLLLEGGEKERAVQVLERAAERLPDNRRIQYRYARALDAAGYRNRARQTLDAILDDGAAFSERSDATALRDGLGP